MSKLINRYSQPTWIPRLENNKPPGQFLSGRGLLQLKLFINVSYRLSFVILLCFSFVDSLFLSYVFLLFFFGASFVILVFSAYKQLSLANWRFIFCWY